jgi:cobalt-zinc-cadmium efflux system outer membrane protein
MNRLRFLFLFIFIAFEGIVSLPRLAADDDGGWTLESAVRRMLEVAPERRAAKAEIAARAGAYREAAAWPNPTVALRIDNKLGLEDRHGGADFTQVAVSQPLPIWRLGRERTAAAVQIEAARSRERFELLRIEREAAGAFHRLQLAQAKRALAEERTRLTDASTTARDKLVRYLAPAERERLVLLGAQARQALSAAHAEENRAAAEFRALLSLPGLTPIQTVPLRLPPAPPALETLERAIEGHPQIEAARRETEAALAGIDVAVFRRFSDPELNLFLERDFLNDARRHVAGIGVSIQVPLWGTNPGPVERARAEALQANARAEAVARDARSRMAQVHARILPLREQIGRAQTQLLAPAERMLRLTRRAFAVGEVNVLALVDALDAYVEINAHHLDQIEEVAQAWADLHFAAGQSLLGQEVRP